MNWCIIQIVPLKLWIRYRRCERNGLEVLFTEAGFFVAMVLLVESCVLFHLNGDEGDQTMILSATKMAKRTPKWRHV